MIRPLMLMIALGVAACGLASSSEDEVKQEFAGWISEHNACQSDAECVLVSPGCPLGCASAVRADSRQATENRARDLIARYQRGGRSCEYECVGGLRSACAAGRCAVVTADPP